MSSIVIGVPSGSVKAPRQSTQASNSVSRSTGSPFRTRSIRLVDLAAIKGQLVRRLRQGISQFASSKVAEIHVHGRSLVEQ